MKKETTDNLDFNDSKLKIATTKISLKTKMHKQHIFYTTWVSQTCAAVEVEGCVGTTLMVLCEGTIKGANDTGSTGGSRVVRVGLDEPSSSLKSFQHYSGFKF